MRQVRLAGWLLVCILALSSMVAQGKPLAKCQKLSEKPCSSNKACAWEKGKCKIALRKAKVKKATKAVAPKPAKAEPKVEVKPEAMPEVDDLDEDVDY